MSMRSRLPIVFGPALLVCVGALASLALAQGSALQAPLQMRAIPKPAGMTWKKLHGKAYFNTNVGSFKLLANDAFPCEGTLDVVFRGTVLISNLDPASTLVVSGNVRKEIDDKTYKRQVFFGDGRITLTGKFRSVQFFGRGLRGAFDGNGFMRLYGEFDKDLDTGYYWLDPTEKIPWSTGGSQMVIPSPDDIKPRVKVKGKGG